MPGAVLVAGRRIAGIGLGIAQFAFRDGTAADSVATIRAALDAGVQLIDTALAYTRPGAQSYAEQVVATALGGVSGVSGVGADRPLVATKGGHWRDGDRFPVDGRPQALRAHCEIGLRTLAVDRIDLYFRHYVDPRVPLAESIGALAELRAEGKIAAIGLSNVTLAQLDDALALAPVAAVQNPLSYGAPGDLPTALGCAQRGVAYLAYQAFNGPHGAAAGVAGRRGASVQRVLLAWLPVQSPNIVPLTGASRPASIRDSATPLDLTAQDLADLGPR